MKQRMKNRYQPGIVLILLLLTSLGYWCRVVQANDLVPPLLLKALTRYTAGEIVTCASPLGYLRLTRDNADTGSFAVTQFTWDGTERFRITITPDSEAKAWSGGYYLSQSPDGHYIATIEQQTVRIWNDGLFSGSTALPENLGWAVGARIYGAYQVCDNGQVYVWSYDPAVFDTRKVALNLFVVDSTGLIAQGSHASSIPLPNGSGFGATLSPDGAVLVYGITTSEARTIEYVTLEIIVDSIIFTPHFTTSNTVLDRFVGDHRLLMESGALYDATGEVKKPDGWWWKPDNSGRYRSTPYVLQQKEHHYRVLNIATQQSWTIESPSGTGIGNVSPDGRYLVLIEQNLKEKQNERLALYQQDGRLVATCAIPKHPVSGSEPILGPPHFGIAGVALSPNGHMLIMPEYTQGNWEYVLYQW